MKKKVTLSLDDEVYKEFQKYCESNDIMLSKRIERIMKNELKHSLKNQAPRELKKLDEFLEINQ